MPRHFIKKMEPNCSIISSKKKIQLARCSFIFGTMSILVELLFSEEEICKLKFAVLKMLLSVSFFNAAVEMKWL